MPKTKEEIAAAYDSPPWWYDIRGFFILTFAYNSTLFNQLRFFGPHFGAPHLEVACGTGTLLEMILWWRKWMKLPEVAITGIDYAEPMLIGARRRFAHHKNMTLAHADAAQLPFATDTFQTANIANAIHCFPNIQGALKDIYRVLKPGGTLAANVLLYPRGIWPLKPIAERINQWGMKKGILFTPYTQEEVDRQLNQAGFQLIKTHVSGNCYNVLARK
jgi:ubiquinone/menaquinone biosynthesis C-methylase UbiE